MLELLLSTVPRPESMPSVTLGHAQTPRFPICLFRTTLIV
jgi:hypothetical protein